MQHERYDVVIIGAGLAGLTLARQLLGRADLKILHLEKKAQVPGDRQKVGESNVQVQGYYLGKVLDLEEYLFHEHLMKYNLRFYWKTPGEGADDFGHYSQSYIRKFSNIPCYQLDRNKIEKDLAAMNRTSPLYNLLEGAQKVTVQLSENEEDHSISYVHGGEAFTVAANWVVDSSGRNRKLASDMGLKKKGDLNHSSTFFWVDGIINIEKMGTASAQEKRLHKSRRELGHLPSWLATNHFMGKGFWFWVIPLQGRTSFGLVYNADVIDPALVTKPEKLLAWLYEHFPMFEAALAGKEIVDFSVMHKYTHDCTRTLDRNRYAMTGEAGRFTDPLYSPGGDLISIHNTLITQCILEKNAKKRREMVGHYETMFQIFYKSFLPSYAPGYSILGDQEAFAMKYTWELAVYFGFFVFPFINDLLTERNFLIPYFRRLANLGDINHKILNQLAAYCTWKEEHVVAPSMPHFFEFTQVEALRDAEKTFYEVGLNPKQAIAVLDEQLLNLKECARYFLAHMDAVMTGKAYLCHSREYVEAIDFKQVDFCADRLAAAAANINPGGETYAWRLNAQLLNNHFPPQLHTCAKMTPV